MASSAVTSDRVLIELQNKNKSDFCVKLLNNEQPEMSHLMAKNKTLCNSYVCATDTTTKTTAAAK